MKKILLALCIGIATTCATAGDFRDPHRPGSASTSNTHFQVKNSHTSNHFQETEFSVTVSVSNSNSKYQPHRFARHPYGKAKRKYQASHKAYSKHKPHRTYWR